MPESSLIQFYITVSQYLFEVEEESDMKEENKAFPLDYLGLHVYCCNKIIAESY